MSKKNEMSDCIRRLAIQYQQMVEAADALESVGVLENTLSELGAKITDLSKEFAMQKDELIALQSIKKAVDSEAKKVKKASDDYKDSQIKAGMDERQSIITAAQEEAKQIVALALSGNAAELSKAKASLDKAKADLKKTSEKVSEAELYCAQKVDEANAAELKLADIKLQLSKMIG